MLITRDFLIHGTLDQYFGQGWSGSLKHSCYAAFGPLSILCRSNRHQSGADVLRHLARLLRRHRVICGNLDVVLPNRSSSGVEVLARGVWASFGQVLAEFAHLPEICGRQLDKRVALVFKGSTEIFAQQLKPAVFVGAYLANWELSAAAVARQGTPLAVVFTPEKNALIARMVLKKRRALSYGFVSKDAGLKLLGHALIKGIDRDKGRLAAPPLPHHRTYGSRNTAVRSD